MNYEIVSTAEELGEHAQMCKEDGTIMAIYGKGGDGKTSVTQTVICPALGLKGIEGEDCFKVNASGSAPSEVKGTGSPDMETREMFFSKPTKWPLHSRSGTVLVSSCWMRCWSGMPPSRACAAASSRL